MTPITTADKSPFVDTVSSMPAQFLQGYQAAQETSNLTLPPSQAVERIIVAGLGGSALVGELLADMSYEAQPSKPLVRIPVVSHRQYGLPHSSLQRNALLIINSHSGDTQETVDVYNRARKTDVPFISVSSGGALHKQSQHNKTPHITIPTKNPYPRFNIGYHFGILLYLLEAVDALDIPPHYIQQMEDIMDNLLVETHNTGKTLSEQIGDATPLIFAPTQYQSLAYTMQIFINENANTFAFSGPFPEIAHNLLMGYENPDQKRFYTIVLVNDHHTPTIQQQKEMMRLIQEQGAPMSTLPIYGETIYEKFFRAIFVGIWTSYYLAKQKGIDPLPTNIATTLKQNLANL